MLYLAVLCLFLADYIFFYWIFVLESIIFGFSKRIANF